MSQTQADEGDSRQQAVARVVLMGRTQADGGAGCGIARAACKCEIGGVPGIPETGKGAFGK